MKMILNIKSRTTFFALALVTGSLLLVACGNTTSKTGANTAGGVRIVAAENFWGSIASQLGGDKAQVKSIISNPDTDPHDYEPTPTDGILFAQAQLVIVNGLGYDDWAKKAIAANASSSQQVIKVGELVGLRDGDNPHRWYSPANVELVTKAITEKLKSISAANAGYFDAQQYEFNTNKLARYNELRTQISQKFGGANVGATESIFAPLASDLKLNLITPATFLNAISEGNDPTAADKATADEQLTDKKVKILVYNSQNTTPDVQRLLDIAKTKSIPVVAITETLTPANATFQDWQTAQLEQLLKALAQ